MLNTTPRNARKTKLNYSSSFKGPVKSSRDENESPFRRDSELRHSTGSIKGKRVEIANTPNTRLINTAKDSDDQVDGHTVNNLIKGFQSKIVNGSTKRSSNDSSEGYSYQSESYTTPGYVAESPASERSKRPTTKRKLSLRYKKGKMSADDARHSILQSLGMSPFAGNENRNIDKTFAYFDTQSLFFAFLNAATLKCLYEEGSSYTKKLTGASAASVRTAQGRKRVKSGEFDSATGRFRSRAESMIDEGDNKVNDLVLNCPYFRNEIAEPEESADSVTGEPATKHGKDIAKLISMFNRNRSFENLRNNSYDRNSRHSRSRREFDSSEQDILLEEVKDDSSFLIWDEPNVSGKRIFDFEHIDRGSMYYREYFSTKEHTNLFGIDEKYGPMAISIIREVIPKMAVLGHNTHESNEKNKKYQYRLIVRTCELYALRISLLENSIPSTSRHGGNRPLPIKDVLEFSLPEIQFNCLRHCVPGPKISEQLIKLDEQQLNLKIKIGLIYCKAGQKSEEEMYNNENGGSEFLEFCSVIADKVALKGFQGYRAQLDNKNDSTGAHSLYTTFHGREIMFHVSTELPYTNHDRQQLLRKRHIGNDIVTVIFQEPGSEPFTPQMMRSHFQHVFIIIRVENPHSEFTRYEVAVTRSRDVPYFGPPIPPNKFSKNAALREFLLSKLINAENAAHKSDKFTHMARRTRYEYLKDLATNQVSTQTIEPSNKFAFSFKSKNKEKNHPPVNPEIWLQGGMVWEVKFDYEHDGPGSSAYLSISTKACVFVEQSTQEILLSIPCKHVLGWRPTSHTLKLFYDNGKMAYFTLCDDDRNELPYVVNRLKAVTPGCETQDLALRRNNDGQLGFHVFYEGLVAEVEPYGLAWQAGLRKGSRLLEISSHVVGGMSHERMILMLKRPGAVRIVVLPPAPDGQPRNYKAVRNLRRYSSMTSVYSMSAATLAGVGDSSSIYSSKENMTGSATSSPQQNTPISIQKSRSQSAEGVRKESQNSSTSDTSSYDTPSVHKDHHFVQLKPEHKTKYGLSAERLITSRSASDIPSWNSSNQSQKKKGTLGPSESVELELGEIERQLTDTRKSIDAKFYRSLANSPSPFFRNSKPDDVVLEEDGEVFTSTASNSTPAKTDKVAHVYTRRASDLHYPIVNEKLNIMLTREVSSTKSEDSSSQTTVSHNDNNKRHSQAENKYDPLNRISNRSSLEQAFENSRMSPTLSRNDNSNFVTVEQKEKESTKKQQPIKSTHVLRKSEPIELEIDAKIGRIKLKQGDSDEKFYQVDSSEYQGSFSDSSTRSRSKSQETLSGKDSDAGRRGNIVRTTVRDAKEIISERRSGPRDSPTMLRHAMMKKQNSAEQALKGSDDGVSNKHSGSLKKQFSNDNESTRKGNAPFRSGSPQSSLAAQLSPRHLTHKDNAMLRAVDVAARNKAFEKKQNENISHSHSIPQPIRKLELRGGQTAGKSPDNRKFDESLVETFAKIDAAFGFKPSSDTPPRDEKRKKKRSSRRRSRNFEPPSSDSSDDVDPDPKRRGNRTPRRQHTPDDLSPKLQKSEAEESLEAALCEFQMELSTMPEKTRTGSFNSAISASSIAAPIETSSPSITPREDKAVPFRNISSHAHKATRSNEEIPPAVPLRTSRPQSLIDHQKLRRKQSGPTFSTSSSNTNRFGNQRSNSLESASRQRNNRVRSEATVCMTSLRPWSPPLARPDNSATIKQNVKGCANNQRVAAKIAAFDSDGAKPNDKGLEWKTSKLVDGRKIPEKNGSVDLKSESYSSHSVEPENKKKSSQTKPKLSDLKLENDSKAKNNAEVIQVAEDVMAEIVALEDQLSPLPRLPITPNRGGIHSLPNRSKKRRATVTALSENSTSASSIPLAVRGLDLAANNNTSSIQWSKEDLHVMITVMENELEQERVEKERLAKELSQSKVEKERLLEQSKQAASQLRKFTSLFLDASPQELEKAKQRYSDAR